MLQVSPTRPNEFESFSLAIPLNDRLILGIASKLLKKLLGNNSSAGDRLAAQNAVKRYLLHEDISTGVKMTVILERNAGPLTVSTVNEDSMNLLDLIFENLPVCNQFSPQESLLKANIGEVALRLAFRFAKLGQTSRAEEAITLVWNILKSFDLPDRDWINLDVSSQGFLFAGLWFEGAGSKRQGLDSDAELEPKKDWENRLIDRICSNLNIIGQVEQEKPGATKLLYNNFEIVSFGRFPAKQWIKQAELLERAEQSEQERYKLYDYILYFNALPCSNGALWPSSQAKRSLSPKNLLRYSPQSISAETRLWKITDNADIPFVIYELCESERLVSFMEQAFELFWHCPVAILDSHGGFFTNPKSMSLDQLLDKFHLQASNLLGKRSCLVITGCQDGLRFNEDSKVFDSLAINLRLCYQDGVGHVGDYNLSRSLETGLLRVDPVFKKDGENFLTQDL